MALPASPDVAALAARIALGLLFIPHGWMKIKDLKRPIAWVRGTGWPGGAVFAVLFTLLEVFGAIALIGGLLTQVVAILFVLEMIATTTFQRKAVKGKYLGGYEIDVALMAFALVLAILGPGPWSVDRVLGLA